MSTLNEAPKMDWDNYNPGSSYQAPPPVLDANGKKITYFGLVPKEIASTVAGTLDPTKEGYAQWKMDPILIQAPNQPIHNYRIRFSTVNTKQFEKNGKPINASSVGNFLRSAGVQAKPQTNKEYETAMNLTKGKVVAFTIEWEARNKDTQEEVKGYLNFPLDPERPGLRKAILKQGDLLPSGATVKSEVLFANARVHYYVEQGKK